MKSYLILFIVLFTYLTSLNATTYYVSSSQGNDSNNGTSLSTPWKTFTKVNNINFNAGDQILLKRGDTWSNQQLIIDRSGNQSNFITFGAYGSGNRPILSGNNSLTKLIDFISNIHHIIVKEIEFKDINPIPAYSGLAVLNKLVNNVIIDNCKFSLTLKSQGQHQGMIYMRDPHHITIKNSEFTGGMAAITIYSNWDNSHNDAHHIEIDNNWFHNINTKPNINNNGVWGIKSVAVFIQNWWNQSLPVDQTGNGTPGNTLGQEGVMRDFYFSNNNVDSVAFAGILAYRDLDFVYAKVCDYNIFVSNNNFNLIATSAFEWRPISNRYGLNHPETGQDIEWSKIEYNTIDSIGYDYVTKQPAYNSSTSTTNAGQAIESHGWKQVLVQYNNVQHFTSHQGDGHGFNFDYGASRSGAKVPCDSVVVRYNVFANSIWNYRNTQLFTPKRQVTGVQFFYAGVDNYVHDNIFYNLAYGVRTIPPASQQNSNYVFNNTIYDCDFGIVTASNATQTIGTYFKNNIIYKCRNAGWFNTNSVTIPATHKSNNLWFGNPTNFMSVTGGLNDIFANPFFKDTLNKNFSILPGGAGINKGINVTLLHPISYVRNSDIVGTSVPFSIFPDIGAHEYFTGSSQNPTIDSVFTSNITTTSAILKCDVNTGGLSTTTKFQWDTDNNAVWANNQPADGGAITNNGIVQKSLTGLAPNTTYYYRAYITNSSGSDTSIIRSFITSSNQTTVTGTFYMTNASDDFMYYNGSTNNSVSRFGETSNIYRGIEQIYKNISVPQNAQITSAILEVKANTSNSGTVVADIYTDLRDDPSSVLTYSQYNENTNFSSLSDQYSAPAYSAGDFYQINITNVIQDRVNNSNWTNGDNLGIIIKGNTNLTSGGYREITRAENSLTHNKLIITYNTGLPKIADDNGTEIQPDKYELYQNYPNPFNPSTNIKFNLPEADKVKLDIFNILGENVITLIDREMLEGFHSITFDAGNLPSGIYIYRLQTGNFSRTMKMILVR